MKADLAAPPPNWAEIADLAVQRRLAGVAEQMLTLTWFQIAIAVFGTIGLFITFWQTRKATAAAFRAVRVQQATERAVLVVQGVRIHTVHLASSHRDATEGQRNQMSGHAVFKNIGKSLAQVKRSVVRVHLGECLPSKPSYDASSEMIHRPLESGEDYRIESPELTLSEREAELMFKNELSAWIFGEVAYVDLFEEPHLFKFCYRATPGHHSYVEDGGEAFWSAK